jgi:hypothetical protein
MNKNTLNLGLVVAIVGILVFLLMVILEPGMFMMSALGLIGFAAAIIVPIIFIRKERSQRGGFITFGEAFKLSFFGLAIGGAIAAVFQILYTGVIDPDFGERMTAKTLEFSNQFMEGAMSDEQREEILRQTEADAMERWELMGQIQSFGIALILYAVLSLILAAVLKKNPDTENAQTLDS